MKLLTLLLLLPSVIVAVDIAHQFCHTPSFTHLLPLPLREKIIDIWKGYSSGDDCHMQITRTRNLLYSLSPQERARILSGKKTCQLPAAVSNLPLKAQQKILEIWRRRDPHGDCKQQQRKTRLILLNLPAHLRSAIRPTPFQCDLPHFVYRLEPQLQTEIKNIWIGYKKGTPCYERIDQQLQLLQKNDISVESFQMPPMDMFTRLDLVRKFRRASRA